MSTSRVLRAARPRCDVPLALAATFPFRFLLACSVPLALAATCDLPRNLSGREVWDLHPATATDAASCAAACCAQPASCSVWQWCPVGAGCVPPGSCWVGPLGGHEAASSGWISFAAAGGGANVVNATRIPAPPVPVPNVPPSTSPTGGTLSFDTSSLRIDGVPVLPVGGEMHPGRVPAASWATDLRAMKAGGLDVVSAYIFWIHVEEQAGVQDWSGSNDVRAFVLAAQDAGLMVALRIGPWAHGECRNGGFPEWLQDENIPLRRNDTRFLSYVESFYAGLAKQIEGLYWHQGGPIITAQLDNETPDVDYLLALRNLAIGVGISPAALVKTGWPSPNAPVPLGSMIPLYGGYADQFWSRDTNNDVESFTFSSFSADGPYPYITVEVGGGMASSYHRRIKVDEVATAAHALLFLGSGVAQLGFYMYHGCAHPIGALTTMQEQQGVGEGGANDMPVRTYDFHAPLGEAGQPRLHYHLIRRVALMMRSFAPWIAGLAVSLPETLPSGATDTETLRWATRSDGISALTFVSTVQPFVTLTPQNATRVTLLLAHNVSVDIPARASPAINIPVGAFAAWPTRMPLQHGVDLLYATATPLGVISDSLVFFATEGVRVEFAVNGSTTLSGEPLTIGTCSGVCTIEGGIVFARGLVPSLSISLSLAQGGVTVFSVLLLDDATSVRAWIAPLAGAPRLLLSDARTRFLLTSTTSPADLTLVSEGVGADAQVWVFPPPSSLSWQGVRLASSSDGVFMRFSLTLPPPVASVVATPVSPGGPARTIPKGLSHVAQEPGGDGSFSAFADAALWHLALSLSTDTLPAGMEVQLSINYSGDCARVYTPGGTTRQELVADHFYNGHTMDVPLSRLGFPLTRTGSALELRVLPLGPDDASNAPIYFEVPRPAAAQLLSADVIHVFTAELVATP